MGVSACLDTIPWWGKPHRTSLNKLTFTAEELRQVG